LHLPAWDCRIYQKAKHGLLVDSALVVIVAPA
jgi:hypothetical protein